MEKRMTYSDVVAAGLILPFKAMYTMCDVRKILTDSLFRPGGTFSEQQAKFIARCSAVFHDTDYSAKVGMNCPGAV